MGLPETKQSETEARVNALTMPGGAAWAVEARNEALARVQAKGMPARRDEYWKFTSPHGL